MIFHKFSINFHDFDKFCDFRDLRREGDLVDGCQEPLHLGLVDAVVVVRVEDAEDLRDRKHALAP